MLGTRQYDAVPKWFINTMNGNYLEMKLESWFHCLDVSCLIYYIYKIIDRFDKEMRLEIYFQ
jgi:hypothetical protein